MCDDIRQEDALKALGEIRQADPRNSHIKLSDWHGHIAGIELVHAVPVKVCQIFENAKNTALYSYFTYRLHQVAELVGYIALEEAFKERYKVEKVEGLQKKPKTLKEYMEIGLAYGWIKDEGFQSARSLAVSRLQRKTVYRWMDEGVDNKVIPVPSEDEIIEEMRSMQVAHNRLQAARGIRNILAHGGGGVSPSSIETLFFIAEIINQLFSDSAP